MLTTIILCLCVIIIAVTAVSMLLNKVLARISFRNLFRRKSTTFFVILGSLVGTALITGSQVVRDSFNHTSDITIAQSLGEIDIVVNSTFPTGFESQKVEEFKREVLKDKDFDSVVSLNTSIASVQKIDSNGKDGVLEGAVTVISGDWKDLNDFGHDISTKTKISEPDKGETILNQGLANRLDLKKGETVKVTTGTNSKKYVVTDVVKSKGLSGYSKDGTFSNVILNKEDYDELTSNLYKTDNTLFVSSKYGVKPEESYDAKAYAKTTKSHLKGVGFVEESVSIKEVKDSLISQIADNNVGTIFLIFSLFGIASGVLLIINIYSMLAEERKSEMGILRAISLTRGQLIRLYAYEGLFYSVLSSFTGLLVGVGIGALLVSVISKILNAFLSQFGVDSTVYFAITPQSLAISLASGLLFTYVTVVISSFFISKLNIVSAIRGIPEEIEIKPLWVRILSAIFSGVISAVGLTYYVSAGTIQKAIEKSGAKTEVEGYILYIGFALLTIFGAAFLNKVFNFFVKKHYQDIKTRIIYTSLSVVLFIYSIYSLVSDRFEDVVKSSAGFVFIVGFVSIITLSIFISYNLDLLISFLNIFFQKVRGLAASIKIALRYPSESKSRTGLTITMFSMVIFIIVFVSIIRNTQMKFIEDSADKIINGYDAYITTDIEDKKDDAVELLRDNNYVSKVETGTTLTAEFPEVKNATKQMRGFGRDSADAQGELSDKFTETVFNTSEGFFKNMNLEFVNKPKGMSDSDVLEKFLKDDRYIILSSVYDPLTQQRDSKQWKVGDKVKMNYVGTDLTVEKEILAIQSASTGAQVTYGSIYTTESSIRSSLGNQLEKTPKSNRIFIKFQDNTNTGQATKDIKISLARLGLTDVLFVDEFISNLQVFLKQFIYLLQGFLSFGLVVGMAGLVVIMIRSVQERKQQIGMLRSLGFTRSMILQSFIIESSLISILGITSGLITGSLTGYLFYTKVAEGIDSLQVVYPWQEILIIAVSVYILTVIFSLAPSINASKLEPVEATNYPE